MKYAILLIFIFHFSEIFAQNISIQGKITDTTGVALEAAQIILYKANQKSIVAFGSSNWQGYYRLSVPPNTEGYYLAIRLLGYQSFFTTIDPNPQATSFVFNVRLQEDNTIQTITVTAKPPAIKQRGDTTTYQAEQFRSGTERNLEDILKKLPGVTVNENGEVFLKGKQIKKLLVEGDDLFDKDYKIGTKNISADMIDEIQGIENFTDTPNLKGIVDANDSILNIKLKGNKAKPFGDISLSGGVRNRFDVRNNLFFIQKKHKFFWLAQGNNVGFSPYSLSTTTLSSGAPNNNLQNPLPLLIGIPQHLGNAGTSDLRANLNRVAFSNFTYFGKISKKTTFRLINQFYSDRNELLKENNTDFLLQSESFSLQERQQVQLFPQMLAFNFYLLHTANEKTRIENTLVINDTKRRYTNNLQYNISFGANQPLAEAAQDGSQVVENRFKYSNRFSAKQGLLLHLTLSQFERHSQHHLLTKRFNELFNVDSSFYQFGQVVGGSGYTAWANAQWLSKIADKVRFKLQTDLNFQDSQLHSNNFLQNSTTTFPINDSAFLNRSSFGLLGAAIKTSLGGAIRKNLNWITELALKRQQINFDNKIEAITFLEPLIGVSTSLRKASFSLSYTHTQQNASLQNLLRGYILADYRTFQRGADELHFLPAQMINFVCNINDIENFRSLSIFGLYNQVSPFYGAFNDISQNFNFNQYTIFPRQRLAMVNLAADQYIHAWLSGFQWNNSFVYNSAFNQANNFELIENQFFVASSKLQYRSVFDGFFNT